MSLSLQSENSIRSGSTVAWSINFGFLLTALGLLEGYWASCSIAAAWFTSPYSSIDYLGSPSLPTRTLPRPCFPFIALPFREATDCARCGLQPNNSDLQKAWSAEEVSFLTDPLTSETSSLSVAFFDLRVHSFCCDSNTPA